jgi:hypothetical protein
MLACSPPGSIKEWGWTTPALVGEDGGLIAGHARVLAARQLGIVEIPVMVAAGWTEAQKRAYVLADNQLAITGSGWDPELELGAWRYPEARDMLSCGSGAPGPNGRIRLHCRLSFPQRRRRSMPHSSPLRWRRRLASGIEGGPPGVAQTTPRYRVSVGLSTNSKGGPLP